MTPTQRHVLWAYGSAYATVAVFCAHFTAHVFVYSGESTEASPLRFFPPVAVSLLVVGLLSGAWIALVRWKYGHEYPGVTSGVLVAASALWTVPFNTIALVAFVYDDIGYGYAGAVFFFGGIVTQPLAIVIACALGFFAAPSGE